MIHCNIEESGHVHFNHTDNEQLLKELCLIMDCALILGLSADILRALTETSINNHEQIKQYMSIIKGGEYEQ